MAKRRNIIGGFVNINLETDENQFGKVKKEKDFEVLMSNIKSDNLRKGFIEGTDAVDLTLPMPFESIVDKIGIRGSSIQLAVVKGSQLYGVDGRSSDWDLSVVTTEFKSGYRFYEFEMDGYDYDIHVYSVEEFQRLIDRNEMRELEVLSYPKEAVLVKTTDFIVNINKAQLITMVRAESDELWARAKRNLENKVDEYQALKTIWHSIRFLIFAEQLLRFGKVRNLSAANTLRGPIVGSNTVDFEFFEINYGPLREQMKLDLGRHIGENLTNISQSANSGPSEEKVSRYVTVNFQGLYVQKGNSLPNVEARYIRRNTTKSVEDDTWRMFIKFGDYIEQNWRTFNPPNTDKNSPECKEGCITGYKPNTKDNFQHDSKIFFGQNPDTKEFGDLRLRIRNAGAYPVVINGEEVGADESITVVVDSFDYKIKLPTNTTLLLANEFYQGNPLDRDTLTECIYDFTFEVDYDGLGFGLRNFDNSVSKNKEFNLGTHNFAESYSFANAELTENHHMLVSQYENIWPYWESEYLKSEQKPYCLPSADEKNQDMVFPTKTSDLQNAMIDGLMFLHQTETNANSESTTKTNYVNFKFLSNGQSVSTKGCSSVPLQYPKGEFAPQLQTTSIPFQVI